MIKDSVKQQEEEQKNKEKKQRGKPITVEYKNNYEIPQFRIV